MARRRRRTVQPARRKSSSRRKRLYTVTCGSCGAMMQVPVEPPRDIQLTCVECLQGAPSGAADAGDSD